MWGEVLGWALFSSVNPMLLGFILIVISRPRPVPNLCAYWVGCLLVNFPAFLVPLVLLHLNPTFVAFAEDLAQPAAAAGSSYKPMPLALGVLALLIAALITMRLFASQPSASPDDVSSQRLSGRHRAPRSWRSAPISAGTSSILVLEAPTTTPDSGLLGRAKDAATRVGSSIRRLLSHGQISWERGSSWVSFVAGLGCLPSPPVVLIVGLAIAGSGAAMGAQIGAAIVFVFAMFVVVEIILVSCLVAPERTQKVLGPANDWLRTHRRQVLITLFALLGVWQVGAGLGIV